MITKILRVLLRAPFLNSPQSPLPSRSEWQIEFLFLPNKPPLRDDTHCRVMTRPLVEAGTKKTDFQGR
jgi:hypothetical protein